MKEENSIIKKLASFPRVKIAHVPTPIEEMPNLARALDAPKLFVKRDDCTGLAFGGNKVRQLEYYFGEARQQGADTILITGAVQSNYARTTAAMARSSVGQVVGSGIALLPGRRG
jgi:1-aminocyclopropane-1-carboxylate deaminase/D-cysteine desulfhydrase-like pyridoxal-dependent ACC family enzyme